MPLYRYLVLDEKGKKISGELESASVEKAAEALRGMGYHILSLSPQRIIRPFQFFQLRGIKAEELLMFTLELRSMLGAGIPLSRALATLQEEIENPRLQEVVIQLLKDLREGESFSTSLAKHPRIFSRIYVNMVAAGEVSGNLEEVLQKLSVFIQKEMELQQKITTALFYPIILISFGIIVLFYLIVFVFPNFIKIFKEAGVPLPLPTQILYGINLFLRAFWLPVLLGMVAVVLGINFAARLPQGKAVLDRLKFRIPLLGGLLRKAALARFAWSFAGLLGAGVSLLESLETVERIIDNALLSRALSKVRLSVSKGEPIARKLEESKEFPALIVQMVGIGEESGTLPEMLGKVAEHYDMTVDYGVRRLTTLIEPIALIFIGGAVAFIFASLILPIFRMVHVLRR